MPAGPGELAGEHVRLALGTRYAGEGVDDAAVVQVEKRAARGLDQDRRIAVQLRVVQIQLDRPPGNRHRIAVATHDHVLAAVVREGGYQVVAPEVRDHDGEVAAAQTVEKGEVEVVLVLVTDVEVALALSVAELLLHDRGEMVVAR